MGVHVPLFWRLLFLSLTAVPITWGCERLLKLMHDRGIHVAAVAAVGISVLCTVTYVSILLVKGASRKKNVNPFLYVFALFSFTSVLDIGIGLEFDGYITAFITHYLLMGEPYLNCVYEAVLCYYDGFVMYAMYLAMIYRITTDKSYRSIALYWVGTLENSMIVMLLAVFMGKYGLYPSTILNLPYFVLPLVIGWKVWHQQEGNQRDSAFVSTRKPLKQRLGDVVLVMYLIFAMSVALIRALAVLGTTIWLPNFYLKEVDPIMQQDDPAPFMKCQVLVYLFYYVPVYLLSIYALVNPSNSPWMCDLTLIHAGAAGNAQVSHIATAIHWKTPTEFHPPSRPVPMVIFWVVNLLLAVMPQVLLVRCLWYSKSAALNKMTKKGKRDVKLN